jgi:hypothetical protein
VENPDRRSALKGAAFSRAAKPHKINRVFSRVNLNSELEKLSNQ